jgi:branched-chain amino acid transport system ATP-binding protein
MSLLEARGLTRHFGGLRAVDGVDFDLEAGEVHALIGPNGAGKTTFVSLLSGRIPAQSGTVLLAGEDITRLSPQARVRRGLAYTFQITSVFPGLSVFDNVALAVQGGRAEVGAVRGGRAALAHEVSAALDAVGLRGMQDATAAELSYGHQRLLEVAMGLALKPRVLILDEPTQGLAAGEIAGFMALVRGLVPGVAVLLIEHNMDVVMGVADRITVLNFGTVLARGTPADVRADRAVQEAYLGA